MELLEKFWEGTGSVVNGVLEGIGRGVTGLFGTSNARNVRKYQAKVRLINELEPKLMAMSDAELREQTPKFRKRLADGETLDDILVEAFALCREGGRRFLRMRHYDVQMVGGMVLHYGNIAEMVTGEGKTLVATLPAYLNALVGNGVHVVTVNDYLARRDMEWMAPLYMGLGLTVASIQSGLDSDPRQLAYACDITYATNNELGFDYLRDNMRIARRGDNRFPKHFQQSQGPLQYAIIDEVDNILIDEARTPLIISGPAHQDVKKYAEADKIARQLVKELHFVVNEKDHTVNLTDEGVRHAEKMAGVESFYTAGNMEWPHLLDNALKAHFLYKLDVNYVAKEGVIVIVDEFTGRLMEGRQWSDGLHQAVEAKEGVTIKEENQTLATVTLQNFFKLYKKLAGMTGTAMTEANEFYKIYGLDVIAVPTNRPMKRFESPDTIFLTEKEKYKAVADDIELANKFDLVEPKDSNAIIGEIVSEDETTVSVRPRDEKEIRTLSRDKVASIQRKGRPILVGTVSIEKSERLSKLLDHRGIAHQVLNAKQHKREAEIIAQAGRVGAVTIATNMAGRGTDIILGGNPDTMAWAKLQDTYPTRLEVPKEEWDALVQEFEQKEKMKEMGNFVCEIGGLMVIGTERHESRRIDLQLRGRCGRQGDPGSSRFYLSLEDDLMRIFAGDWVRNMMGKLGMGEGEALESRFVSKRISSAQKKVEERHFESRKSLLDYDEVMDQQRKRVYGYRQQILAGVSCRQLVLEQIQEQINHNVDQFTNPIFGAESFARWAGGKLSCQLEPKDFRGIDAETAGFYARDLAEREIETQIMDAIDENLPIQEEQSEWNWEALAKWSNTRYGTNFNVSALKKIERDRIDEEIFERAREFVAKIDLSEGAEFVEESYGLRMLANWMKIKFAIDIDPEQMKNVEPPALKKSLMQAAEDAYRERESQYPVLAAFTRFRQQTGPNQFHIDGAAIANHAAQRFEDPSAAELQGMEGAQAFDHLVHLSKESLKRADMLEQAGLEKLAAVYGSTAPEIRASEAAHKEKLDELANWLRERLNWLGSVEDLASQDRPELAKTIHLAIEDRFYPEIRRMERTILLRILDDTWMGHLLAMDHLRSAVSFRGMAQMDPKVEYKREGMKLFEQMWFAIGERMTDIVFRMEALDDSLVTSSFVETQARHDSPPTTTDMLGEVSEQQRAAMEAGDAASGEAPKPEPIRREAARVGRNDPCTCGSGKKYKNCCMRRQI
ncbi:MAG: SEC-C metal-binding domain-containing protein [Pirellulaceae bacterium]|nr:SEC-C metal-binding domain-containing protein [Pirellulaceae bacterium]